MTSIHVWLIFGVIWLVLGFHEWRVAVHHARLYAYKPELGAAYYWLIASAASLSIAAAIYWSQS